MVEEYTIGLSVSLVLGIIFFLLDYSSEGRCFKCNKGRLNEIILSLIAGVSVTYFFLELLPRITADPSEPWPLAWFEMLPFLLILTGFVFIHFSEKWILQRVEHKTREKLIDLKKIETRLEKEEDNIRDYIGTEIIKEDWENLATLKRLAEIAAKKHHKEIELQHQEQALKKKLSEHLYKDLDAIHAGSNFVYHFLIGLIIVSLAMMEIIPAILFFIFAFFKAEVSNITNRHVEIEGLVFHVGLGQSKLRKVIFTASILFGIITGLIIELFYQIPDMITLFLLAFISGTILYITIREVIPEKGEGKPLYFLVGVILFGIISLSLYFLF